MNRIYTDGTINEKLGIGVYCVALVPKRGKKTWYTVDCDLHNINEIEYAAIQAAVEEAAKLIKMNGAPTEIISDSLGSIVKIKKKLGKIPTIRFRHIRAHQSREVRHLDPDVKRNHWCDLMCTMRMAERVKELDKPNTSE